MCRKVKNKQNNISYKVRRLCQLWSKLNDYYFNNFDKRHLQFPEPILKELIKDKFGLKESSDKSYDFDGNIELKSSTKENGNTPFKFSQSQCKRIIYCEIVNGFVNVYELSDKDVSEINLNVKKEYNLNQKNSVQLNISCGQYKADAKVTYKFDLSKGVFAE